MKNKIYKVLSLLLTLIIVFSACFCVVNTVSADTNITYYISSEGDDSNSGTSQSSPLKTVAKAIELAKSANYTTGDTVALNVLGTTAVSWSAAASPIELPKHDFKLVITSADGKGVVGEGNKNVNFGGDVEFKNVGINFGKTYHNICSNGHNISFDSNCTYNGNKAMSYYMMGAFRDDRIYNNDYTLYTEMPMGSIGLTNDYSAPTFNGEMKVVYNSLSGAPTFIFGTRNATTNYNGTINLDITASSVKFSKRNGTVNFGNNSYVQVLNNTATVLSASDDGLSSVPANKLYVFNNISGDNNLLKFTDTVGKFKVTPANPDHKVIFEKDGVKTYYDNSGFITLDAGVYTVSVERAPYYVDYYVDPEGIEVLSGTRPENAGTKENPVRTFADATRLISQDGLAKMDVATVHLKDGVRNYWKNENTEDATYNLAPANYNCTVVIDSTMENTVAELYSYNSFILSGNLVLRNVNFTVGYQWADSCLADYNLTIEKTANLSTPYLYTWKTEYGKVHSDDQTIIVDGVLKTSYIALAAPYHSHTSTGNFNFYFNNPESGAVFRFGASRETSSANVYTGNININVKQAKTLSLMVSNTGANITGSLQMLIDDSVLLPYSVKNNFDNFDVAGGKWYITNAATDDDFISFTDKGKLAIKDGATAYSRQFNKDLVTHTGGEIDLSSAPGAYTVSDKEIEPLTDDSHKMLYYYTGSTSRFIGTRAKVTPGETYRFEYTIYCTFYEDCRPRIRDDGNRGQTCEVEIISETKIGDCYKIVCEGTIPENYDKGSTAFFGVQFANYSEGIIFDRTVYNVNDPDKKDCFEGNQHFHDGLDYVTLDFTFWGKIFTDGRGGSSLVKWQSGLDQLEIMNYDLGKVTEIKNLSNPNDGEWWDKSDIKEEEGTTISGTATISGKLIYRDGTPIKKQKMLLLSDTGDSFSVATDKNGKFEFKDIPVGFYDLYIVDGEEKIHTGFNSYVMDGDLVNFTVVNDISGVYIGDEETESPNYEIEIEDENNVEIIPSGNLKGTVYTPNLETVSNLKLVLRGIGEVITDENGTFGFADIPVGEYELYAINSDGSEYIFKKYTINENINLDVKLKYDPPETDTMIYTDNGWTIWIIIASIIALLGVCALATVIIIKKKKIK